MSNRERDFRKRKCVLAAILSVCLILAAGCGGTGIPDGSNGGTGTSDSSNGGTGMPEGVDDGVQKREEPAEAGGFPYTVLQTAYTGKVRHPSQIEAYTGLLWQDSRPAAINYIEKVTRQVREKVEGLSASTQNREEYMSYRTLLTELESRCKK